MPYALVAIHQSKKRVIDEVGDGEYVATHRLTVNVRAGDLVRVAGFLEVSERAQRPALVTAFIGVHDAEDGDDMARVTPFAGQVALRGSNHHMPLNTYGQYRAPRDQVIIIEMFGRALPLRGTHPVVVVEDRHSVLGEENDRGALVAEHYRAVDGLDQAMADGYRSLVAFERQLGLPDDISLIRAHGEQATAVDLPGTEDFQLEQGDVLRLIGAATATLIDGHPETDLMSVMLRVRAGSRDSRQTIATENLTELLSRLTIQADAVHIADRSEVARPLQQTRTGLEGRRHRYRAGSNADLVALQFSSTPGQLLVQSSESRLSSDLMHTATGSARESLVLAVTGNHDRDDIIRINSQLWAVVEVGERRVGCAAQIRLTTGGSVIARSIWHQRHLRETGSERLSHPWGAFTPFLAHRFASPGAHRVELFFSGRTGGGGSHVELTIKREGTGLHLDIFSSARS